MTDATLEEIWRIKEKLSAPHLSWDEYAADLYAFQESERKRGAKSVSFVPKRPDDDLSSRSFFVAEAAAEHEAKREPAT